MTVVLDASVILKWLFADPAREELTFDATRLVAAAVSGRIAVVQPVHWLAEVGAVLARATPRTVERDIGLLTGLQFDVADGPLVMQRACRLAVDLKQHVFDTLYHAVAMERDATLVSADKRYCRAAMRIGRIVYLADWKRD